MCSFHMYAVNQEAGACSDPLRMTKIGGKPLKRGGGGQWRDFRSQIKIVCKLAKRRAYPQKMNFVKHHF